MISMIKRNSCGKALDIARMARDMLGGEFNLLLSTFRNLTKKQVLMKYLIGHISLILRHLQEMASQMNTT